MSKNFSKNLINFLSGIKNHTNEKLLLNKIRYGLKNNEEMTQKEVADFLGISQSYISRLEKKIIKKLKYQLNK